MLPHTPQVLTCNKIIVHNLELTPNATPRTLLFCRRQGLNLKVTKEKVALECDFKLSAAEVVRFQEAKAENDNKHKQPVIVLQPL
jgi:hypothetical protein